jgi:hypothetical protein
MKRLPVLLLVFALVAVGLSLMQIASGVSSASTAATTLTLDVALDGRTFVVNRVDPASGSIARGDTFVLNGKIFSGGKIPTGGTKSEPNKIGPDSAGAIGEFICRGVYVVGGAELNTAKIQRVTTQYFLLPDKARIVTEGFEGASDITRVVTGGLRTYTGARGESSMQRLGINKTGAYNIRFVFTLAE